MYLDYWKLKEKPFRNTPDPRYLFPSPQHEEAMLKLSYCVAEGMGGGLLSGVFGCGKTLLGQALLNELGNERYRVAYINHPQMSAPEILRSIVRCLKATALPKNMLELMTDALLEELQDTLIQNVRDGLETVVVIDEAHAIDDDKIFDCLRMLLNFQLQDKFLLTLLLFGQPEIREKVQNLKQLDQRIAIRCHLDRFDAGTTRNYILHRLKIAGGQETIFTEDAFAKIFDFSGGIPRRINHLCDLSLLTGMGKKAPAVSADIVANTQKEFGAIK